MRLGGMKSIFGIIGSLVMAKSPSIAARTLQFRTKVPSGSNMVFTQTSVAIRYSFLLLHKSLVTPLLPKTGSTYLVCHGLKQRGL